MTWARRLVLEVNDLTRIPRAIVKDAFTLGNAGRSKTFTKIELEKMREEAERDKRRRDND